MPHMLGVTTGQIGDPVPQIVLMKADDCLRLSRISHLFQIYMDSRSTVNGGYRPADGAPSIRLV